MTSIDTYARKPEQALIDVAADPFLQKFIDNEDVELITIDYGDGTQAQAEALALRSVQKFINRILDNTKQKGVDLKEWICSPEEFDLCHKLHTTTPGELMRQLDEFLSTKKAQAGLAGGGLVAMALDPFVGGALTIFSAVGFVNNGFVNLCGCPRTS